MSSDEQSQTSSIEDIDETLQEFEASLEENETDEYSDDEEISKYKKKPKKNKKPTEADFTAAIAEILSIESKNQQVDPILSKARGVKRQIRKKKLDSQARKLVAKEKRERIERHHIIPDSTSLNREKELRKTATKGVVKLFNAIKMHQKSTKPESVQLKSSKKLNTLPKEKFLELLKDKAKE